MAEKTCFVCNFVSEHCQSNFVQIKSQHSGYPLLIFMRKFLRKYGSSRSISDPFNCICEKCLKRVNEYDDLCVKAKRIEDDLHKLLINSDKSWKSRNEMNRLNNLFFGPDESNQESDMELEEIQKVEPFDIQPETSEQEQSKLQSAIESHSTNRNASTEYIECDQKSGNKNDRPSPMETHNNDQNTSNKCDICTFELEDETLYKEHRELHRGLSSLQCVLCNKKFTRTRSLATHMLTHSSKPNFMCEICGKTFLGQYSITAHMRAHNDIRSDECNLCSKKFRTKSQLNNHMRTHTGEKPFICSVCGKAFSHVYNRDVHEKLHNGPDAINVHKCTFCKSSFARKTKLKEHMQKKHGISAPHTSIENQLDTNVIKARSLGDSV